MKKGEMITMAEIKLPIQVNLPDDWMEQIVDRLKNDLAALIEEIKNGIQKQMCAEEQKLQLNVIQDAVNRNFFDTILWEELKRRKNERPRNN